MEPKTLRGHLEGVTVVVAYEVGQGTASRQVQVISARMTGHCVSGISEERRRRWMTYQQQGIGLALAIHPDGRYVVSMYEGGSSKFGT